MDAQTSPINLHLLIPSLLWSDTAFPEIYQDLPVPMLETLLAKSTVTTSPISDINVWLCMAFKIDKQFDWPVAAIMQRIESSQHDAEPDRHYWLRADPVHLRIEQNHILLADSAVFNITQDESQQFVDAINQLLTKEHISIFPFHPSRWYIRLPAAPELQTHTLSSVTCKNINDLMPTGNNSAMWHKITNEIQMLLHDHPLNQERAQLGQLAINSLWFWGGGFLPHSSSTHYSAVWGNHALTHALAVLNGIKHTKLPTNAQSWLQKANTGNHLLVLDDLSNPDKYNDAYHWREKLKELERNWFAPLLLALKNKQLDSLKISIVNDNACYEFFIKPSSLWKFWSRLKPLSFYADK